MSNAVSSSSSSTSQSHLSSSRPPPAASGRLLQRQDSKGIDSRFCCNICLDAVVEPVVTQCGHLYCWKCLYRWLEHQNRQDCPVCKAACSVGSVVPIYVREPSSSSSNENAADSKQQATVPCHNNNNSNRDGDLDHSDEYQQHDGRGHSHNNNHDVSNASLTTDGSSAVGGEDYYVSSQSTAGLLRRRRRQPENGNNSSTTGTPNTNTEPVVPSRPSAISPRPPPPSSPSTPLQYRNVTPLSPGGGHRSSLSHGILLSLQQATTAGTATSSSTSSSTIPSLRQYREGGVGANPLTDLDAHPDATEYLSRLLLMLASFVVLCLLML